jgi:hypothetical protein
MQALSNYSSNLYLGQAHEELQHLGIVWRAETSNGILFV